MSAMLYTKQRLTKQCLKKAILSPVKKVGRTAKAFKRITETGTATEIETETGITMVAKVETKTAKAVSVADVLKVRKKQVTDKAVNRVVALSVANLNLCH